MSNPPIILPKVTRGFTDFYKLNVEVQELATAFGYTHQARQLNLPEVPNTPAWAHILQTRLQTMTERVGLGNEATNREVFVVPILTELVLNDDAKMRIEYIIRVSPQLHGKLDYLMTLRDNLLVVEAKKGDPIRGFNQLLAEMVALDQWTTADTPLLWGALTLGNTWQFVMLTRNDKVITQDTAITVVPRELPRLARVLTAILTGVAPQNPPARP